MKNIIYTILLIISQSAISQQLWQINKDTVITWYYQDGDEFNGSDLKTKWSSWHGWSRSIASNKEQQYFSDYDNTILKDGCLKITTEKKEIKARLVDWLPDTSIIRSNNYLTGPNLRTFKYQAGMLKSKEEYLKGYFEIKFKSPAEYGLWPAFWLYGGTPNEEIDMMELQTSKPKQIHLDSHCPDRCDYFYKNIFGYRHSFGGWVKLSEDLKDNFNIVSGLWDDNEIRYFMNGTCIGVSKVSFNKAKNLVINVAVPIKNGPFGPGPDTNMVNFSSMNVDYVRVWTKTEKLKKNLTLDADEKTYTLGNAALKKKGSYTYGNKSDHNNDGIFISAIKDDRGNLKLFCNGLKTTEYYVLKIKDSNNNVISENNVSAREYVVNSNEKKITNFEIIYLNKHIIGQL